MSAEALPITPAAFAEAIKELTLPVLYGKVAELQNSIAHLRRSNQELRLFIIESCQCEADKQELEGYIVENDGVEKSMIERIQLCKAEVEARGQTWIELGTEANGITNIGTGGEQGQGQGQPAGEDSTAVASVNGTGSSTDAPSAERSRGRENDDEDDGVYL
ncbi:hypothetical protein BDW75DRAFT_112030 [Aspergillus navahoensis]